MPPKQTNDCHYHEVHELRITTGENEREKMRIDIRQNMTDLQRMKFVGLGLTLAYGSIGSLLGLLALANRLGWI